MHPHISITELWVYPVKSLAGVALTRAKVTPEGIEGDRRWMIVDQDKRFITQRTLPRLATLRPTFNDGALRLTNEQGHSITVAQPKNNAHPIQIWRDTCWATPADSATNRWLTQAAGSDAALTLVHFDLARQRALDEVRFGSNTTMFADAAPYLITNQASLDALNEQLILRGAEAVDMRRFRANIVMSGAQAFTEHAMLSVHSDTGVSLRLVDHCQRCSVITVDQTRGIASHNASLLKQLAQLNSMPEKPKAPAFGVNSVLERGSGLVLTIGERLITGGSKESKSRALL